MNLVSRAIFPLIVVVLLVYLTSQTLLGDEGGDTKIAYSAFLDRVDSSPASLSQVTFSPKSRRIEAELAGGQTLRTTYTTEPSAFAKGSGDSAWWSILTYLLPFVLFFGFWIFLMNQVRGRRSERAGEAS